MNRSYAHVLRAGLAAGVVLVLLYLVYRIYLSGHPVLAAACLGASGLAVYVYTIRAAYTYRYLFPGLAGIAIFVLLPLVYTIWIGFTNYSSRNLLTFERATDVLLGEVFEGEGEGFQFTLHREGEGFRIVLRPDQPEGDAEAPQGEAEAGQGEGAAPAEEGSIFDDEEDSIFDEPPEHGTGEGGDAGEPKGADTPDGTPDAAASTDAAVAAGTQTADAGSTPPAAGTAAEAAPAQSPGATGRLAQPFATPVLLLTDTAPATIEAVPLSQVPGLEASEPLPLKEIIARRDAIRAITVRFPDGTSAVMSGLREFAPQVRLYQRKADGTLTNQKTGEVLRPNFDLGFYETSQGERVQPGFRVNVGFGNYVRIFTDAQFRGPFFQIFGWTVIFAGLTVVFTLSIGMLLAELLSWEALRFRGAYRLLLFLPYAVPGFISILVFKGLFNRNFGEINLILEALFGIRPNWFGDAFLAKTMILIVNTWLGYPYFMLLCMGLQKSIPRDLYEASALAGAGPLTNFFKITWPLIRKPLTPLLISSFAFNFNNFVLIFLLTGGRPDFLDTNVPAGETDILVSYTYRIAFEDSGQNFGLAAAISTLIFVLVAILSLINLRLTRANQDEKR